LFCRYACKAYCTARQELAILLNLRHTNIVPLVGLCTEPLSLVLELAPLGALDTNLKNFRRSGAKLNLSAIQQIVLQVNMGYFVIDLSFVLSISKVHICKSLDRLQKRSSIFTNSASYTVILSQKMY